MRYAILFAAISSFVSGCGSGPAVTACVSDPESGGFRCVHPDDKETLLPFKDSGNYVCFSPKDTLLLMNAASIKSTDIISYVEKRPALDRFLARHEKVDKVYREYRQEHLFDHLPGE